MLNTFEYLIKRKEANISTLSRQNRYKRIVFSYSFVNVCYEIPPCKIGKTFLVEHQSTYLNLLLRIAGLFLHKYAVVGRQTIFYLAGHADSRKVACWWGV